MKVGIEGPKQAMGNKWRRRNVTGRQLKKTAGPVGHISACINVLNGCPISIPHQNVPKDSFLSTLMQTL
jgi:hypothetical protein